MLIDELKKSLNNKPTYLFFMVTARCNAFCDHCWNWKNVEDAGKFYKPGMPIKRNELSYEEIRKFTEQLSPMLLVNFYGGEPFIREDLGDIISLFIINAKTRYISFATNAFLTDTILKTMPPLLQEFPEVEFRISISLDGPPEVHNRFRRVKDGYQKVINTVMGLNKLKETYKNLSISCNVNYNKMTQVYLKEFVQDLVDKQYFDSITVDLIRAEPYKMDLLDVDLDGYEEVQKIVKTYKPISNQPFSPLHKAIEQRTVDVVRMPPDKRGERSFNCFCGKKFVIMTDEGDIFACEHLLEDKMGNIRNFNYSLENLLQNDIATNIRKRIEQKECSCRWECAINTSSLFDIRNYPKLLWYTTKNIIKGISS